jgi:LysR family hydrogen peroxide-inducible transcriptional activator
MPTLRQLRYLVAIAEHKHFGRAADACAITQPALSQQMAELEADLGSKLVERTGRGVALTELGADIVARARDILASMADLEGAARGENRILGPLRLGVIPTVAPYMMPALLDVFRQQLPGIELQIQEALSASLLSRLSAGMLDLALLALPVTNPGLETMPLFDDSFFLVVRADRRPAEPINAGTALANELLLLEDGHCLRDQAVAFCGGADQRLRSQFGAASLATLVELVAGGLGCTLVPAMALEALIARDSRLVSIPFNEPHPVRKIGLAFRATSTVKPVFRRLAGQIREKYERR